MALRDFKDARCLNCRYVLAGLDQAKCPECGRPFKPDDPRTFHWRNALKVSLKYWAKPPSLWTIVPAIGLLLILLNFSTWIGAPYQRGHPIWLPRMLYAALAVGAIDLIVRLAAIKRQHTLIGTAKAPLGRRARWRWFAFPACVLIYLSTFAYNWPLKIRFELSRSAMEEQVREPQKASKSVWGPGTWVGFYFVPVFHFTDDDWESYSMQRTADAPNAWFFTNHPTFSGMMLHYGPGVTFLYREADGPAPEFEPAGGDYHPELADPPWYIYY